MADNKVVKRYKKLHKSTTIETVGTTDPLVNSYKQIIAADDFNPIKPIEVDAQEHEEIFLLTLNDTHIGSPTCNIDKILRYLAIAKKIPNCFIILNGDIMNNANNLGVSSSLENALSPMNEQKVIHKIFSDPVLLSKIIVLTSGNHESGARSKESGLDSLVTPAATLGITEIYARFMARLNIKLRKSFGSKDPVNFQILVRHGSGKGGTGGAIIDSIFNLEKVYRPADLYIQGHTHKNVMGKVDQYIDDGENNVKSTTTALNVPSLEEESQYAMEAGYPAPNTDNFLIRIRAVENYDKLDTSNCNAISKDYKFNTDLISLDRLDLLKFSKEKSPSVKIQASSLVELDRQTKKIQKCIYEITENYMNESKKFSVKKPTKKVIDKFGNFNL